MSEKKDKFILKKKTLFSDIREGVDLELPTSDLTFQDQTGIFQFEFVPEVEDDKSIEIEPGVFMLTETSTGLDLAKMELKKRNLLESVTNSAIIMNEAHTFFKRLNIYKELDQPMRRSILLYSDPGMGKTASIEKVCTDLITEDSGTVVVMWPTSAVEADSVMKLLNVRAKYKPECTRMILVMEDIGGGDSERHRSSSAVDSGLLNLLDGIGVSFVLPTFIIATTNHPQSLLASLADRPGRFDNLIKLNPPSADEKIALTEFIAKRSLSDEEKQAVSAKEVIEFSIAHLKEVIIRSLLHDKTIPQVIKEIVEHKKLFKRDFEEQDKTMGFGFVRD